MISLDFRGGGYSPLAEDFVVVCGLDGVVVDFDVQLLLVFVWGCEKGSAIIDWRISSRLPLVMLICDKFHVLTILSHFFLLVN